MQVITLHGKLINVGPWDEQRTTELVVTNPWIGEGDPPEDWNYMEVEQETILNPLPERAIFEDLAIQETAKGRLVLSSDWETLRQDEYPPLTEQLDAMWKGGQIAEDMQALINSIKLKYPKPSGE